MVKVAFHQTQICEEYKAHFYLSNTKQLQNYVLGVWDFGQSNREATGVYGDANRTISEAIWRRLASTSTIFIVGVYVQTRSS